MANILSMKGLGVKVTVKVIKKHKFVDGSPELSHKGEYTLTLSAGSKSVSTKCVGTGELFAKCYAMMSVHFPKSYAKFQAISKVEKAANKAKAKANHKAKKAAASGVDLKSLAALLNRAKKGNGKMLALFL